MAIKAALAASLLVALLSLAAATTTITTVVTDETNPDRSRQCSQQVQGRQFIACQRYMQQGRSTRPLRPYFGEEEEGEEEEEFGPANPQQQSLQECCQQLREMDRRQCGCEAIRHAARQAQQQGGRSYQTGQSERIYQRARELPRRCNLSQQQCRFNVVFV